MVEKTTFRKLKDALIELMRGYPEYGYYGKLESYLTNTKEKSVDLLINHEIIEELPKEEVEKLPVSEKEKDYRWYRLKPRGVDLAISMVNLEHSERILKYTKETRTFNIWIKWLTIILSLLGIIQILLIYFQNPIF